PPQADVRIRSYGAGCTAGGDLSPLHPERSRIHVDTDDAAGEHRHVVTSAERANAKLISLGQIFKPVFVGTGRTGDLPWAVGADDRQSWRVQPDLDVVVRMRLVPQIHLKPVPLMRTNIDRQLAVDMLVRVVRDRLIG